MDYSKRYPITQLRGEFILLSWTKAYRSVKAEYNGEVLFENKTSADLKKGVTAQHHELGEISCKFAKEKMVVNILVDGLHSPINKDHPSYRVKSFSTFIWIIFGMTSLTFILELLAISAYPYLPAIILGPVVTLLALTAYFLGALNLRKGKYWGFWLAFAMFTLRFTYVFILNASILSSSTYMVGVNLGLIIRGSFLLAFILIIPTVLKYMKHEKHRKNEGINDELLDVKI